MSCRLLVGLCAPLGFPQLRGTHPCAPLFPALLRNAPVPELITLVIIFCIIHIYKAPHTGLCIYCNCFFNGALALCPNALLSATLHSFSALAELLLPFVNYHGKYFSDLSKLLYYCLLPLISLIYIYLTKMSVPFCA